MGRFWSGDPRSRLFPCPQDLLHEYGIILMFSTKRCVSAACSDDATERSGRAKNTSRQRAVERTRGRGLKRSFQATLLPQVVRWEAAALFFAARCPIAANCASRVPKKIAQSTKTQPQHGAMHMNRHPFTCLACNCSFLALKERRTKTGSPHLSWRCCLVHKRGVPAVYCHRAGCGGRFPTGAHGQHYHSWFRF